MAVTTNYSAYADERVFTKFELNIFCNRLIKSVFDKFGEATLLESFALTGAVGRVVQGDAVRSVRTISFITYNASIYKYLQDNISRVFPRARAIVFERVIQIDVFDAKVEIWLEKGTLNAVEITHINCQTSGSIPSYVENYGV